MLHEVLQYHVRLCAGFCERFGEQDYVGFAVWTKGLYSPLILCVLIFNRLKCHLCHSLISASSASDSLTASRNSCATTQRWPGLCSIWSAAHRSVLRPDGRRKPFFPSTRSEEHTSELQSRTHIV